MGEGDAPVGGGQWMGTVGSGTSPRNRIFENDRNIRIAATPTIDRIISTDANGVPAGDANHAVNQRHHLAKIIPDAVGEARGAGGVLDYHEHQRID